MNVTPYEISIAFEKRTADALRGTEVQIAVSWQEVNINVKKIMLLQTLSPGAVYQEEKGQGYLSRRVGNYKATLSVPQQTNPKDAIILSSVIEGLYRGQSIYTGTQHRIVCDEPYTTIVGRDSDTKRYILYTDVPWHVFFNDQSVTEVYHG